VTFNTFYLHSTLKLYFISISLRFYFILIVVYQQSATHFANLGLFNTYCRNYCFSSIMIEISGWEEIGTSMNPLAFMTISSHHCMYKRLSLILRCFLRRLMRSIDHIRQSFLPIIVNVR